MSEPLISDEAIEQRANKFRPNATKEWLGEYSKVHIGLTYEKGAREMRELMLSEIVAPLVKALKRTEEFQSCDMELVAYYTKGGVKNHTWEVCNYARLELRQHAERVGETK